MTSETIRKRINSIDAMRGIVIIIMLLDHVRERVFLHVPLADPMVIETTTEGLFFGRLLAHFCAPTFVFLTGLSAWLFAQSRDHDLSATRGFLLKRGVFLVFLEIVVINFSWMGHYETLYLQVIWAIGLSMLALACCVSWPRWLLLSVGGVIVAGHNLLSPISFEMGHWFYPVWTILHDRGMLLESDLLNIRASYPVLPWIGIILLGYAAGPLYAQTMAASTRQRALLALGLGSLALFVLLRSNNFYGEPSLWQHYASLPQTLMSFFNLTKYPPSLNFSLLTLGGMFLGLLILERYETKANKILSVYGGAPMFVYIVHLYFLLIAYSICYSIWGPNKGVYFGVDEVWQLWLISGLLTLALYKPTKAFERYKRASTQAWIKYL
ncbi:DUF1624 domain-containing protein [Alginatibacterium sediminis]|uniref:DUF1624 domain-containing protein n=1 Tax=Alginatibacterium sediminis TaxID=2164068 RepID=A0A420EA30_9ALTE|nr:heparan-alpha-glucosaminide N-acetyltransferase domain-containing protein [Alginatibacterium sediminis]RKF17538.1 DUF1624 domain-containing protein [Alginatibacterium sediminis]